MKTLPGWIAPWILLIAAVCHGQQETSTANAVTEVTIVNTVAIEGDPVAIFDLATTARLWPEWHPASVEVAGVTERPFRLDDRIQERVRMLDGEFEVVWKIVEHVRPQRIVMQAEGSPVRITYTFQDRDGITQFKRELAYPERDPGADPQAFKRMMEAQSQQALRQLKALIEKMLHDEAPQ